MLASNCHDCAAIEFRNSRAFISEKELVTQHDAKKNPGSKTRGSPATRYENAAQK